MHDSARRVLQRSGTQLLTFWNPHYFIGIIGWFICQQMVFLDQWWHGQSSEYGNRDILRGVPDMWNGVFQKKSSSIKFHIYAYAKKYGVFPNEYYDERDCAIKNPRSSVARISWVWAGSLGLRWHVSHAFLIFQQLNWSVLCLVWAALNKLVPWDFRCLDSRMSM